MTCSGQLQGAGSGQPQRLADPGHDLFQSGTQPARTLDAFGYGFKQDWGAAEQGHQENYSEADQWLRKSGMWNDYSKGQSSIIKAANEVIMRPAVSALTSLMPLFKGVTGGAFHGAQEAVVQAGEEVGAPNAAREVAAIPEAFPAGFHQMAGVPHLPEPIAQAKSRELNVIGSGEAGYFGTRPVGPESRLWPGRGSRPRRRKWRKPQGLPGLATPKPDRHRRLRDQPVAQAPSSRSADSA